MGQGQTDTCGPCAIDPLTGNSLRANRIGQNILDINHHFASNAAHRRRIVAGR